MKIDQNYWLGRWKRGETGWHQTDVEPTLMAHFSNLKPTRVFVPLCGKSLDLAWLASQGHQVIGVELSELASREFFKENGLPFQQTSAGTFTRFEGDRVTILNGDFFELTSDDLGPIGAVYDRAALIALSPELRAKYAAQMIRLLAKSSTKDPLKFLQIVLERTPSDETGPPYSVSTQELQKLYASFKVTLLSRESVDMGDSSLSKTEECAYFLSE